MGTDSYGREIVRYTVRIELQTGSPKQDRSVEYHAITSLGDLKAAAMAAVRAHADNPEAGFGVVEIVSSDTTFKIDPERDLLDYWGGMD
jgi:hypothetical protein